MSLTLFLFFTFFAGACMGSLLTMMTYRLPRIIHGQESGSFTLNSPRSHCPNCRTTLCWYDNVPLISWLILHGQCRYCAHPISRSYPLTELSCALLYLLLATLLYPNLETLIAAYLLATFLLSLSLIDIKYLLLPDILTLSLLWLGIMLQLSGYLPHISLQQSVIGVIAGYAMLWLPARLYYALRRKEALGMGDAKLLAAEGAWLGCQALPLLLLLASTGTIFWILLRSWRHGRSLNHPVPFGPALSATGFILFLSVNINWP